MTKRLSKKTKPAKRNPTDITLRNLRAIKKRIDELETWAFKNFLALENEIIGLEDRLTLAKQGIFTAEPMTKRGRR